MFAARVQLSPNPSLVLAPESALSLLPSIGLSSAPAACSVSGTAVLKQYEKEKKGLLFTALSDMRDIRHLSRKRRRDFSRNLWTARRAIPYGCAVTRAQMAGLNRELVNTARLHRLYPAATLEYLKNEHISNRARQHSIPSHTRRIDRIGGSTPNVRWPAVTSSRTGGTTTSSPICAAYSNGAGFRDGSATRIRR